ncbi:MAG: TIGR02266 family protein [Myxococcota bacterium]|nr:TIGR02266 family protein [Myxococcota bacterium]
MASDSQVQKIVERRRSARAPVSVRVEYETVDSLFAEFSQNINEGGIFIETEAPLAIDEKVKLSFQLPGAAHAIEVTGRVARIEPAGSPTPGMGVEFDALGDSARRQIDELVRGLKTTGPEAD